MKIVKVAINLTINLAISKAVLTNTKIFIGFFRLFL